MISCEQCNVLYNHRPKTCNLDDCPLMKQPLTFSEFQTANIIRCSTTFPTCAQWDTAKWFMALTGEVGELANILKKIERGDFTLEEVRDKVAGELADIFTYTDLLATHLGISFEPALIKTWNNVSERRKSKMRIP